MHPAPDLLEVAQTWWDVDRVPVVTWDHDARRFDLVDPQEPRHRLRLAVFRDPVAEPARLAAVFAEAFAACDFPPTGDGVPRDRAQVTLRANGIEAPLAG